MGDTAIQWCDKTWNPVTGCTKVSPGCAHCYAEGVAERFWATQYPPVVDEVPFSRGRIGMKDGQVNLVPRPRQFTDVQTHKDRLLAPLSWRKPVRVFVNSMSDLFHEDVPDGFIDYVFAVMALAPQHTFQILTKRPERMRAYLSQHDIGLQWLLRLNVAPERHRDRWSYQAADAVRWTRQGLPNVWLGVSVENQHCADERIPLLLQTPAAVRFLSCEPLIGPVDLSAWLPIETIGGVEMETWPSWVICGGESGPKARPCDVAWVRSIVKQCHAAGVKVFVKQLGANAIDIAYPEHPTDAERQQWQLDGWCRVTSVAGESWTKHPRLTDRKGGEIDEWPADLRVREFPEVTR